MKLIDLSNKTFGRLTVLSIHSRTKERQYKWLCRCVCGVEVVVYGISLKRGATVSCGCYKHEVRNKSNFKHGHAKIGKLSSEYRSWSDMKKRCTNPKSESYSRYGGRGISVCDRWYIFENFISDMGIKPTPSYTIERDNPNGNYEPTNCRWATKAEQKSNKTNSHKITFNGETKILSIWAAELGIGKDGIKARVAKGLPLDMPVIPTHIILNTQTGIFYNSIREVANTGNYNYSTMVAWLSGRIKNRSPFIIT